MRTFALAFALAAAAAIAPDRGNAEDWPVRPVTFVVPYAAGGPNDAQARILAARLSELLHQQIIIENVGVAGGMTGANRVAKAAPDGYTMLLAGLGYWGIGFVGSWILAFPLGYGAVGLWWGILLGTVVVAVLLTLRISRIGARL